MDHIDERLRRGRAAPTIHDVARKAGVSISTVSKALNAGGRLSQATRDKVLRVAREIGYRPNDLAVTARRAPPRLLRATNDRTLLASQPKSKAIFI